MLRPMQRKCSQLLANWDYLGAGVIADCEYDKYRYGDIVAYVPTEGPLCDFLLVRKGRGIEYHVMNRAGYEVLLRVIGRDKPNELHRYRIFNEINRIGTR